MPRRRNQHKEAPIRIMQVNVGRSSSAHDIALASAQENRFEILLIQEPWTHSDLFVRRTKSNYDFETFSPLSTWSSRPRVITYIRKDSGLKPFQVACDMSRDVVKTIITCENRRLPIWNIYNAPTGSDDAGGGLTSLLICTDSPFFVGGDFNLRHPLWDSSILYAQRSCSDLIDWYESRGLKLLNPTETPTHNRGGTLDLAFCSDNSAKCEVCPDLHLTSEHETLVTTLRWTIQNKGVNKLQYRSLDNKLFVQLLYIILNIKKRYHVNYDSVAMISRMDRN